MENATPRRKTPSLPWNGVPVRHGQGPRAAMVTDPGKTFGHPRTRVPCVQTNKKRTYRANKRACRSRHSTTHRRWSTLKRGDNHFDKCGGTSSSFLQPHARTCSGYGPQWAGPPSTVAVRLPARSRCPVGGARPLAACLPSAGALLVLCFRLYLIVGPRKSLVFLTRGFSLTSLLAEALYSHRSFLSLFLNRIRFGLQGLGL